MTFEYTQKVRNELKCLLGTNYVVKWSNCFNIIYVTRRREALLHIVRHKLRFYRNVFQEETIGHTNREQIKYKCWYSAKLANKHINISLAFTLCHLWLKRNNILWSHFFRAHVSGEIEHESVIKLFIQ